MCGILIGMLCKLFDFIKAGGFGWCDEIDEEVTGCM